MVEFDEKVVLGAERGDDVDVTKSPVGTRFVEVVQPEGRPGTGTESKRSLKGNAATCELAFCERKNMAPANDPNDISPYHPPSSSISC